MLLQNIKQTWFRKVMKVLQRLGVGERTLNALYTLLHRIKFLLAQKHGIMLKIEHAGLLLGRLNVTGWGISQKKIARIDIYLDATLIGTPFFGVPRLDVKETYPFITQSLYSGFHFHRDISRFLEAAQSEHRILVNVIREDGVQSQIETVLRSDYAGWIHTQEPDPAELEQQQRIEFSKTPLVTIILTISEEHHPSCCAESLQSVLAQTYSGWELCVVYTASPEDEVRTLVESSCRQDNRIRLCRQPDTTEEAAQLNAAIAMAQGAYIGLLDGDDTLAPFALFELVRQLNERSDADYLYSDEDWIAEAGGRRSDPCFKPDWSPDFLRSTNYLGAFSVFRTAFLQEIGGFREEYTGDGNYDLVLRMSEHAQSIVHIPSIFYHRRLPPADRQEQRTSGRKAAEKALGAHLERIGRRGEVIPLNSLNGYKICYTLEESPKISILIPNKDHASELRSCVTSILDKSLYRNFEILIIENHSVEDETFLLYEQLEKRDDLRILEWTQPFNYSAINNFAATHAEGEILLLLNNDTEVISPDWLERMLEYAIRPNVGAVGAKLSYPDDTVQHGGLIIGKCGGVGHFHKFFSRDDSGYMNRLQLVQNISVVTAACLMVRKEVFELVGGFDERYSVAFNDVDFCLKIRQQGLLIVWTPYAELYHFESKTRIHGDKSEEVLRAKQERQLLRATWESVLEQPDPYYNHNMLSDWGFVI